MTHLQTADVTIHLQPSDATLPVMVTPEKTPYSTTELQAWLIENKVNLQQWLNHHGAILFRGFPVESPPQFQDIASVFCDEFSNYIGGNSPRTKVMSHIFTSTEYPKEGRISMHNEASYLKLMPSTILFFCVKPAAKGGKHRSQIAGVY